MKTSKHTSTTVNTGTGIPAEDLNILNHALDELLDAVSRNHLPFLGTEGQRKGLLHTALHDLHKAMSRPRTCIYPGCAARSVRRSHTIQKGGPLTFIAEDSHVVAPGFASNGKGYSVIPVGVNEASTFPGFCQTHEALFHAFERVREIRTDRDIALQVFRTICREIAVKRIQIAHIRKMRDTHDRLVAKKSMEMLKRRLGDAFVRRHGLRSVTLEEVSKAQVVMVECEKEVGAAMKGLENDFLPASAMDVAGRGGSLYHVSVTVHQPLPVCLAGVANFWIDDHGKRHSVRTILNVLPSPKQTVIVATTLAIHQEYLNAYMTHMLDRMNGPLVMVETWMVRGTDHWFMTPSEWENVPQSRRARILADMLDESVAVGEAYPVSVLDSVREQALKLPEAKAEPRRVYEAEASKLADRISTSVRGNTKTRR